MVRSEKVSIIFNHFSQDTYTQLYCLLGTKTHTKGLSIHGTIVKKCWCVGMNESRGSSMDRTPMKQKGIHHVGREYSSGKCPTQ